MLKKSLIAIALLGIALPAMAGDAKFHEWPVTFVPQPVTTIDVILDVGYFIHVVDQSPIEVTQNTSAQDPFTTYVGCKTTDVTTNFPAELSGSVSPTSAAGGNWSASFAPSDISPGTTSVEICVSGSKVQIVNLVGGAKNVKVAELTVMVAPQGN